MSRVTAIRGFLRKVQQELLAITALIESQTGSAIGMEFYE